jgi:hypothetical protein
MVIILQMNNDVYSIDGSLHHFTSAFITVTRLQDQVYKDTSILVSYMLFDLGAWTQILAVHGLSLFGSYLLLLIQ